MQNAINADLKEQYHQLKVATDILQTITDTEST